jgi:phage tail-like protein
MPPKKPHPHHDPYREYTFQIKWDGRTVAGVRRVSPLRRTVTVVEYRQASDPVTTQKLPGRVQYEPITLERGITHDPAFANWAAQVSGTAPGLSFRKEVRLEVYDARGKLFEVYKIYRCWPSEYVAVGGLETGSETGPFQSLTLENEGWERDTTVPRRIRRRRARR